MKYTILLLVFMFAIFLAFGQGIAKAQNFSVLTVGSGDGSNSVPFGGLPYQDRYQQFIYPWVWSAQKPIMLKAIAFSSNPIGGSGVTDLNVTIRVGTSDNLLPTGDFNLNLPKGTVVYNGPITASLNGTSGDLRFPIKLFRYDPRQGKSLVIDIEIHSFEGFTGSYRFGTSADTGRVYKNPADGSIQVNQNAGLQVRLEFVPPDK